MRRREKKLLTASVVLTPRLREAIDRAAREEQRSRSSMLRVLLERVFDSQTQKVDPEVRRP